MRVLVVDDEPDLLTSVGQMLKIDGYDVLKASSGREAIERLAPAAGADKFDVLLTDIIMAEHDGIEVIRQARERHPDLWIIAMSGGSRSLSPVFTLNAASVLGADKILYKPFTHGDLLGALKARPSR